jgi:choline-sulfatase
MYEGVDIPLPMVSRQPEMERHPHDLRLEKAIALDAVEVSDDEIRTARRAYYANVTYIDEWVGRLRAALTECGMARDTTIIFTADHGDMLGEYGLWYKMTFREWSARIPLIVHRPDRFTPARVSTPVSQVDVLPTLMDIAGENTGIPLPEAIDPLDGCSLVPATDGANNTGPPEVIAEYLAEGTSEPMLMIRQGSYKFIQCPGDPDLLFDLSEDPEELCNLAENAGLESLLGRFREKAASHWDPKEIRQRVVADQKRRRDVHAALRIGRYQSWDFQPHRDASNEYTRSHHDLTRFDIASRYPRPPAFGPRWK